jgi:arylsulfatase A-like enzyme
LAGGVGPWNHRYKQGPYSVTWHRNEQLHEETGHVTDLLTREAVNWIDERDDMPFFLYVPFTVVHLPVKEPEEWLARVPANIPAGVPRQYAACIMHLDDAIGRIIAALEAAGKRDNTLLVFTSDNGGSTAENNDTRYPDDIYPAGKLPGNNTPFRGKKGTLYEGGIRVPTIASWPDKLRPGKCEEPIHITDWMPTFCRLAGYRAAGDLKWDGTDIWPSLTGESPRENHPLYWAGSSSGSQAVRRGDWKLITRNRDDSRKLELFNLADDPHETKNLAPSRPKRVAKLQQLMTELARADGDSVVKE